MKSQEKKNLSQWYKTLNVHLNICFNSPYQFVQVGRLLSETESNRNIRSLLRQCDEEGPAQNALVPTYHCMHTPGGPLKYSLEGHQFAVFGFKLTSDFRSDLIG